MRVRHLQTYLYEQRLLNSNSIEGLRDMRIGIDAVYWLRTLLGIKDPFADAIGGLPPSLYGVLDQQLEFFAQYNITPTFVFQGMQPKSHMLFTSSLYQQMDEAWLQFSKGNPQTAQTKFAQATSRISSDSVRFTFNYLKSKGCDSIQAPYFASAQLAHFVKDEYFDAVFGPPSLVLFGVPRTIVGFNFKTPKFEWIEFKSLLNLWHINSDQFVDACLLAGTEFCLTFPFLNLSEFHHGCQPFNFGTAIEFIRQAPLVSYMQHFPTEEMRNNHLDGYCTCRVLIQYPLVLAGSDASIIPLTHNSNTSISMTYYDNNTLRRPFDCNNQINNNQITNNNINNNEKTPRKKSITNISTSTSIQPTQMASPTCPAWKLSLPDDYHRIVGVKLPKSIYYLMAKGVLTRKLPSVLALGEWLDHSHPTVDSIEYRELLTDIREYRCRSVGLLALRMHQSFQQKPIRFSRYTCSSNTTFQKNSDLDTLYADCHDGFNWTLSPQTVREEMTRQGCTKINLSFCLKWHDYAKENQTKLFHSESPETEAKSTEEEKNIFPCMKIQDKDSILALVHMMLLENLSYFTEDGDVTVFSSALTKTPEKYTETMLFVLEMMKFGVLTGDPLEAPPDRQHPADPRLHKYTQLTFEERRKHLLLSRVMSLYPAKLKSQMWASEIDFDLAAYHSIVKILSRSLRQMTEACVGSLLLDSVDKLDCLPENYLDPMNPLIPCFIPPRNCIGVIVKYMLGYDTERLEKRGENEEESETNVRKKFELDLKKNFPCCVQPLDDVFEAIQFWNIVCGTIDYMDKVIDVGDLKNDLTQSTQLLISKLQYLHLDTHPLYVAPLT